MAKKIGITLDGCSTRETNHWVTPANHLLITDDMCMSMNLNLYLISGEIFHLWCWGRHHLAGEKPTTGWPLANHLLISDIILFMNFKLYHFLIHLLIIDMHNAHVHELESLFLQTLILSVEIFHLWCRQVAGEKPTTWWPGANHWLVITS